MRMAFLAIVGLCMVQSVQAADRPAVAEYLRCEYRVDPLGIGATAVSVRADASNSADIETLLATAEGHFGPVL